MVKPRYSVYFIDTETKEYVFTESGPNRQQMQDKADWINKNAPWMKAIVLKSHHPNDRIDPYHQDDYKSQKAFA